MSHKMLIGLVAVVAVVAAGVGIRAVSTAIDASDSSAKSCPKSSLSNLAAAGSPTWLLKKPGGQKLATELSYRVGHPERATAHVNVAARRGARSKALPRDIRIGAFVLGGGLSDGSRGMGFTPVAAAKRSRDGRSVRVGLCVQRPGERGLSAPGKYTGKVRVAGPRVRAVDVPVSVSIRGNWIGPALIAVFVSIIGALMPFTTKPEDGVEVDTGARKAAQRVLALLPFASGLAAGCLAAFLVYVDDPTWGAERGADTIKLVVAAYAAASAGLAATALPTKATRRALAQPTVSGGAAAGAAAPTVAPATNPPSPPA